MTPRPPLDELLALFRSTIAREGVTTGDGDAAGDSIIDAALIGIGANSFVSMLMVVYPGDFNLVDSMDITAFNDATGEVTLARAYKEVAALIPAGVPYKIVTFRFVPAEVAAIEAKLDNAIWGLSALAGLSFRPTPHLIETWQTEAIDVAIWGTNVVATGLAIFSAGEAPYLKVQLSGIAAADEACLYGLQRWFCNPDTAMAIYLEKSILRVLHMEFELRFDDAVILDNTKFFMGLGSIQAAIETTNNIVGFALDASDNLDFISRDAGETRAEDVVLLADLADWHKYEIVVSPGQVECFIDEVSGGVITTNMPETAMYPVFHLVQEAGAGNPDLNIGVIRIWSEDILR